MSFLKSQNNFWQKLFKSMQRLSRERPTNRVYFPVYNIILDMGTVIQSYPTNFTYTIIWHKLEDTKMNRLIITGRLSPPNPIYLKFMNETIRTLCPFDKSTMNGTLRVKRTLCFDARVPYGIMWVWMIYACVCVRLVNCDLSILIL